MSVIMHENYTLVTRHPIILLHHFAKCIFLLILSITILVAIFHYKGRIPNDFITLVLFPIALLLMNYAFMKFILAIVSYYNKIVIIAPDKIIIIDSTLLLQEDIEIIDLAKVVKIDVECHGILSAIL